MMTASPTVDSGIEGINSVVEKLTVSWRKQLSAAATHAALIVRDIPFSTLPQANEAFPVNVEKGRCCLCDQGLCNCY